MNSCGGGGGRARSPPPPGPAPTLAHEALTSLPAGPACAHAGVDFARDVLQRLPGVPPTAPISYRDDWPSLFVGAAGRCDI
eukprot:COSAG01_NODE_3397_length_6144_cov_33.015550_6_plen_81_part_00